MSATKLHRVKSEVADLVDNEQFARLPRCAEPKCGRWHCGDALAEKHIKARGGLGAIYVGDLVSSVGCRAVTSQARRALVEH